MEEHVDRYERIYEYRGRDDGWSDKRGNAGKTKTGGEEQTYRRS